MSDDLAEGLAIARKVAEETTDEAASLTIFALLQYVEGDNQLFTGGAND